MLTFVPYILSAAKDAFFPEKYSKTYIIYSIFLYLLQYNVESK
jgi:hypothetical protein